MKNIKFSAIIFAVSLCTVSCKKYLEVNPKTEVTKDLLFEKESGFQDALAGVYIQLKEDNGYGKAMTMTTIEDLVSSWDATTNSSAYWLGLYNYEESQAETAMNNIYRQLYKVIGSINGILMHIDNKKQIFSPGMYELIKGECLALRAYCHFDLLRLFGPVPTQPAIGNNLPYVKVLSKNQNALLSFEAYKIELLNDLEEAEKLLKDDPFTKYSMAEFKNGTYNPINDFSSFRYLRMNYYAVKGLQARVYLWFKEDSKAYDAAKVVIDAKNSDGSAKFRLGRATDMAAKDYVLTAEHVFGLHDFQLYTKYQSMFPTGNVKKGANETLIRDHLYGNTGTDIREANLWEIVTNSSISSYVMKKYQVPAAISVSTPDIHQIPMIRISEMYLIAMEAGPSPEAQLLWEEFKNSRNFTGAVLSHDPEQKTTQLISEYRKEFYGEGQAFFAYKRVNAPKSEVLFIPPNVTPNYLPPMPKIETTIIK